MNRILIILLLLGSVSCSDRSDTGPNNTPALASITINEAVRTLLYLPIYHAIEAGYFEQNGIDVQLVTAGSATASFAAMLSGEADMSVADPMYVPISAENGARTKVLAQIVGRIAVWIVASENVSFSVDEVRDSIISTHPRPMTAYTYTLKALSDLGLSVDDATITQIRPPNEITPLFTGGSKFAFTLEPNASIAESRGGFVVGSFPQMLGDQIFTGLMATEEFINENSDLVGRVVESIELSLLDLHSDIENGVRTARAYFPGIDEEVILLAVRRITEEQVVPRNVVPTEESWSKSMAVRVQAGDLESASALSDSFLLLD